MVVGHTMWTRKCRPIEGWNTIAFAKDWQGPPRLQNGTSWFYFATDQWKYEESNVDKLKSPLAENIKHQHPADYNAAARMAGCLHIHSLIKTVYYLVKRLKMKVMIQMKPSYKKRLNQLK